MFVSLKSAIINGIDAIPISIEIDAAKGLPSLNIIGLATGAAKESKDRVIHVLQNNGIDLPPKKITINLAPADLKKDSSAVDLPIALGLASVSENLQIKTEGFLFAAELSLNGVLRPIKGVFPMGVLAKQKGLKLIVSKRNEKEAALSGAETYGFDHFSEVLGFLLGKIEKSKTEVDLNFLKYRDNYDLDFADVKGQLKVKRAITIAAAGFHNILMIGSPGVGKSMIAKRIPTVLPEMNEDEILTTTKIYSVSGLLNDENPIITKRPFRSPHSGSSDVSLIGGGASAMPGEITLAHNGVLFLDEFPEFKRNVIESLRQPLEDGVITISRAKAKITYPSRFLLVAAMNPCPCGYYGSKRRECTCTIQQIRKYRSKISGPILDRIDIQIKVPEIDYDKLSEKEVDLSSSRMREMVNAAVEIQKRRFKDTGINFNSQMNEKMLKEHCKIDEKTHLLLKTALEKFGMSLRSYSKILKIARTIADLEASDNIRQSHIKEAISYRVLEWEV